MKKINQKQNVFIIGAGATASIVKLFYPHAKTIAPAGRSYLPVHYVWDTKYTRKFMKQFNIAYISKDIKVFKGTGKDEIQLYNKITHKPKKNKPSKGKKEIKTLICTLPDFPIDIQETVIKIKDDYIITSHDNAQNCMLCNNKRQHKYEYDLIFICSPLLFKPFGNITYFPMRIYQCESNLDKFPWDYAYLGKELLKNKIYRASKESGNLYLEQAGDQVQDFKKIENAFFKFFGEEIKIKQSFVNKYAHFKVPKIPNKDTKKWIYASRLASLDNEFLFSTLIEKIYKLR